MTTRSALLLLFCMLFYSCTIPREARKLKNTTKEWRKAPIVLSAYRDTPFSGIFLTLRNNQYFECTSSGLVKSFEAGTWSIANDTILLDYMNSNQHTIRSRKVIIDRTTSTLIFEGDSTPVAMRMRLMVNEL